MTPRLFVFLVAFSLATTPSPAGADSQDVAMKEFESLATKNPQVTWVMAEMASEEMQCATFYAVIYNCYKEGIEDKDKAATKWTKESVKSLTDRASRHGQLGGVSAELLVALGKKMAKEMMQKTQNSCTNIPTLAHDYVEVCKALVTNPVKRSSDLLTQAPAPQ